MVIDKMETLLQTAHFLRSCIFHQRKRLNHGGILQMKHFNFRKLLAALAIIIIVQNGTVIVYNTAEDNGSYSEEDGIAPCSDRPYPNDLHD